MTETTKRQKRPTSYTGDAVLLDGIAYQLSGFPPETMKALAGAGLVARLIQSDTPQETYADLKSGARTVFREPKAEKVKAPAKMSAWRQSAANVHAEYTVRSAGVKALPGRGIRATNEYASALADAQAAVKTWGSQQMTKAKAHPDIVAEHAKLTGKHADLFSLFATPATAEAPEQETELAEAAD
jgi:hypothetical protein